VEVAAKLRVESGADSECREAVESKESGSDLELVILTKQQRLRDWDLLKVVIIEEPLSELSESPQKPPA